MTVGDLKDRFAAKMKVAPQNLEVCLRRSQAFDAFMENHEKLETIDSDRYYTMVIEVPPAPVYQAPTEETVEEKTTELETPPEVASNKEATKELIAKEPPVAEEKESEATEPEPEVIEEPIPAEVMLELHFLKS